MKITIAASHRFHLLDLARELENHGHDVNFYSYVSKKRNVSFGLSEKSINSLFLLSIPFLLLVKISKNSDLSIKILHSFLDLYVSYFSPKCDLFIGLGTVYLKAFQKAKKQGAMTILEWGSKHIDVQQEILSKTPNYKKQNPFFTRRSKLGYEIADYIAISSSHTKDSFLAKGIPNDKLLVNPYGVDLKMFFPTKLCDKDIYDLLIVGSWSYRKGADLLTKICSKHKYSLLHVGSIVDIEFPQLPNMTHIDSVDQKELVKYYEKGKVFVLPSREEGLAMVQMQALVCGLPIVCSKDTGGRDLKKFLSDEKWVIEMESFDLISLHNSIKKGLEISRQQKGIRDQSKEISQKLDWKSYGNRYQENINTAKLKQTYARKEIPQ